MLHVTVDLGYGYRLTAWTPPLDNPIPFEVEAPRSEETKAAPAATPPSANR